MNAAMRYFAATRPAFLSITALAVLLGFAHALYRAGTPGSPLVAVLAMLGALLAHAGTNVLNDVADADNGSDEYNENRVAPFTGGSRFIQLGLLTRNQMQHLAWWLFAASAACGALLLLLTGPQLLFFGLAGLLGIAYSAPPFRMMTRGLGEAAVAGAFLLIVAGSDFVLRGQFALGPWLLALPLALQAALILIVNEIPDLIADRNAGKRNLIVRLGTGRAALLYGGIATASYLAIPLGWLAGALPAGILFALLALPLGIAATLHIHRHAATPARMLMPIRLTLLQAHAVGIALLGGLLIDRTLRIS